MEMARRRSGWRLFRDVRDGLREAINREFGQTR
jgi:hypothetical protein